MKLMISACLMGTRCRYDGGAYDSMVLQNRLEKCTLIPVCPEQLGGLPTPRPPSEIRNGRVITRDGRVVSRDGRDVTEAFARGAQEAEKIARACGCECALLKERSPSCGSSIIYDGSFTGKRIPGEGVTTALLRRSGITVFSENQLEELLAWIAAQGS